MRFDWNPEKVHAVILAGGKGTRLKPFTTSIPKALMPIGDIPIIEVVLKQLRHAGISNVTIAVGHLAQLIQAFVGNGQQFGVNVEYSFEKFPLGTAGPLGLMKKRLAEMDFFLTLNGDLLTTLDYRKAIEFHIDKKAAATICLNRREVQVEFGVIHLDEESSLLNYEEKPMLHYDVSMGINIFSREALDHVTQEQYLNIPDLMLQLKNSGSKVLGYRDPSCYWLDIGRIEDYQTACDTFEKRRKEFLRDE